MKNRKSSKDFRVDDQLRRTRETPTQEKHKNIKNIKIKSLGSPLHPTSDGRT